MNFKPLVISHRTNCAGAPENSLSGIMAAVNLGVDKIELDVQRSRDGHLVLMHDLRVDRTTNGSGILRKLDYNELSELELVSDRFSGERIPLLKDVFGMAAASQVGLLLEVKSPKVYPGIGEEIAELVEEHQLREQVEVLCFDWDFLRQLKQAFPFLHTCALRTLPFAAGNNDEFDSLGIYYRSLLLRNSFGFSLPRAKKIYAGTPTSEKAMRQLIKAEVDGIITDEPELLLKIRKEMAGS